MNLRSVWRTLVGRPLETERMLHERLTKIKGLAVFSSDALSSSAYATEEVVRVLVLAGAAGAALTTPISLAIIGLLAVVAISYYQTIHAYPNGGGAYIVAKDNLGDGPALVAAAALLVDYVLTVAVSTAAGVAAVTSAVPALHDFRVPLALVLVAFITTMNLRGVRESGSVFAVPTYLFLFTALGLIAVGLVRLLGGHGTPAHTHPLAPQPAQMLTLFLILRAFASGCAALTGVEAVSNGIPAFHQPESRNAGIVLIVMVSLLGTLFIGISGLAHGFGIFPNERETIVSQLGHRLFGNGGLYYLLQIATTMILALAANTAYADFPRLAALVGQDGFLPRQLAHLGDRLVFANGILLLGGLAAVLLVAFQAETHAIIPLYMVGVFISFTLSQAGMVQHWRKLRSRGWQLQAAINGFGAVSTAIVGIIVGIVKFREGAWLTLVVIGALMWVMASIHNHYRLVARALSVSRIKQVPLPYEHHEIVIPLASVHRGVLATLRYARVLSGNIRGVYVATDQARAEAMREDWARWVPDLPLDVLESPYRSVVTPLLEYLDQRQDEAGPDTIFTVIIPEFVPVRGWHYLLHNQTAWALKLAFVLRRDQRRRVKVLSEVPFFLHA